MWWCYAALFSIAAASLVSGTGTYGKDILLQSAATSANTIVTENSKTAKKLTDINLESFCEGQGVMVDGKCYVALNDLPKVTEEISVGKFRKLYAEDDLQEHCRNHIMKAYGFDEDIKEQFRSQLADTKDYFLMQLIEAGFHEDSRIYATISGSGLHYHWTPGNPFAGFGVICEYADGNSSTATQAKWYMMKIGSGTLYEGLSPMNEGFDAADYGVVCRYEYRRYEELKSLFQPSLRDRFGDFCKGGHRNGNECYMAFETEDNTKRVHVLEEYCWTNLSDYMSKRQEVDIGEHFSWSLASLNDTMKQTLLEANVLQDGKVYAVKVKANRVEDMSLNAEGSDLKRHGYVCFYEYQDTTDLTTPLTTAATPQHESWRLESFCQKGHMLNGSCYLPLRNEAFKLNTTDAPNWLWSSLCTAQMESYYFKILLQIGEAIANGICRYLNATVASKESGIHKELLRDGILEHGRAYAAKINDKETTFLPDDQNAQLFGTLCVYNYTDFEALKSLFHSTTTTSVPTTTTTPKPTTAFDWRRKAFCTKGHFIGSKCYLVLEYGLLQEKPTENQLGIFEKHCLAHLEKFYNPLLVELGMDEPVTEYVGHALATVNDRIKKELIDFEVLESDKTYVVKANGNTVSDITTNGGMGPKPSRHGFVCEYNLDGVLNPATPSPTELLNTTSTSTTTTTTTTTPTTSTSTTSTTTTTTTTTTTPKPTTTTTTTPKPTTKTTTTPKPTTTTRTPKRTTTTPKITKPIPSFLSIINGKHKTLGTTKKTTTTTRRPITTTASYQQLLKAHVFPNVKPFYRSYSASVKHLYQVNSATFPHGYKYEGIEGKVIPYSYYVKNKAILNRVCPKLQVMNEVYDGANQYFSLTKGRPIMVVSPEEGYCGATKTMYYIQSLPHLKDTFYTTNRNEYNNVWYTNTFYKHQPYGKAFYLW
ncbi:hypothetical protein QR680_016120 [Steinernema hermaphroditum]|uniref:C-type lectin domain-containing protein n=1 Tax=Steinernema hermaphroditum TaxID=289476 RepID=A0AA39HC17_9BILA|nr:hypothetical protein QR680_016120 [Steinernema hermaphroditum]